jgi:hypothetical protein
MSDDQRQSDDAGRVEDDEQLTDLNVRDEDSEDVKGGRRSFHRPEDSPGTTG